MQEIADQSPAARPLRRRAGLLIGQWVGKLNGEDRPLAYRALLSLLADSDPAMQLAAVASLHALIDDWSVCLFVASDALAFCNFATFTNSNSSSPDGSLRCLLHACH